MKKSKWKTPLCLLVIFILLLILYLMLKGKNEEAEKEEDSGISVVNMEAASVAGLSFQADGKTEIFLKSENEWKNDGDEEFPVDQDAMENLIENIVSLEADRVLEDVEGLSEYGLEEPSNTIKLTDESGTEKEILLGNQNQTTGDYYISLAENPDTVYVTSADLSSKLPDSVMELAESDEYPSVASSDVKEIRVEKAEGNYHLVKNEDTSSWEVTGEDGTAYSAEYQEVSSLASSLTGIVYSSLVDYDADDLSIYGLDQPSAQIYLKYEETVEEESENQAESSSSVSESSENEEEPETVEKELILYIGGQDEDGNYYVRLNDSSQVNTVAEDTLSSILENNSVKYWSSSIGYFSVSKLKSVEITYEGEIRTIERLTEESEDEDGNAEETVSYTSGGTKLDADKTETFLYSLSGMSAQSKDPSLTSPESAEITVTVKTESETFTVNCTPYDENFYLVTDEEGRPGLVNKNSVLGMIEDYRAIWS